VRPEGSLAGLVEVLDRAAAVRARWTREALSGEAFDGRRVEVLSILGRAEVLDREGAVVWASREYLAPGNTPRRLSRELARRLHLPTRPPLRVDKRGALC
jgi:hypothetical protein